MPKILKIGVDTEIIKAIVPTVIIVGITPNHKLSTVLEALLTKVFMFPFAFDLSMASLSPHSILL